MDRRITASELTEQNLRYEMASSSYKTGRKRLYVCVSPLGYAVTVRTMTPKEHGPEETVWFTRNLDEAVDRFNDL